MRRDWGGLAGREHDVLVVGGGVYGAAAAWDAAQRGLTVALVEREDFGSGASWNSLKTIHGGMRYLQKADLRRLRDSAAERRVLLRVAPELVRPLPFLIPARGHLTTGREALAAALALNDLLTCDRNRELPPERQIPRGRTVGPAEALRLVSGLRREGLTGAALYHDAQAVSTERLTLAFVHAAAGAGAACANHAEAVSLLRASGRIAGAAVRDRLDGRTSEVRARVVLNCAGPWCDDVLALCGPLRARRAPLLRARNLVLRRPPSLPFAVGARSAGRFLFLVPWQGCTMVGTSYEPSEGAPSDPLDFLREAASAFPWAELTAQDLVLVHEGLVPGRGGASGLATRTRLLDHGTEDGLPGLVSVQGVKYTTARLVAERVVDLLGRRLGRPLPPCRTGTTPLAAARVLPRPLESATRTAVRAEMALTLADAVLRRLDLGTAGPPEAAELASVAVTMAAELGWDQRRLEQEQAALGAVYDRLARPGPV
ncbi:MAG TPA: FAD-dependent oxidoreductase [Vicinamibacteria bacterium]|nr:FAD-dependent oxidoreductase [Vicinamibacteria bacterium]